MDFGNERYVRLYVRDTTTWKRLGFEGQTVLALMLRKADRAGVIDIDPDIEPWEAAVIHIGAPEDFAKVGMTRCLERGCIVHDGDRLVFPKYIEANETPMSDAQRARESRAKRAELSRNVTAPSQNVMQPSHAVTPSHTASHGVTLNRAVPAVLNRTEPEERERARDVSDHWVRPPEQSSLSTEFTKRYEQATQSMPVASQVSKMATEVSRWIAETSRLRQLDERAVTKQLLDAFFENPKARENGFPPAFLAANPLQYFDAHKTGKGGDSQKWKSRVQQSTQVLEELRDRRSKLQRSAPNYLSDVYDLDKKITEETDRLERRKRELHALTG